MNRILLFLILALSTVSFIMPSLKTEGLKKQTQNIKLEENFVETNPQVPKDVHYEMLTVSDLNLPIASSDIIKSQNEAEGTVVFIPQTHLNPGTDYSDPINNSAEVAQKEIYEIIDSLVEEKDVALIMIEGEKFGQVESKKTKDVEELLTISNNMNTDLKLIITELENEGMDEAQIESSITGIKKIVSEIDRQIYLNGAAYKVMAEKKDILVYGAENEDTYEACSAVVRNYIYQKDQIAKCQSENSLAKNNSSKQNISDYLQKLKSSLSPKNESIGNLNLLKGNLLNTNPNLGNLISLDFSALSTKLGGEKNINSLLELFGGSKSDQAIKEIKKFAQEKDNTQLLSILKKLENNIEIYQNRDIEVLEKVSAPKRENNPYKHINDPEELEKMLNETEEKMQELVVDKRNVETAENFKKALKQTNKRVGILQFGAGHEDGLVDELKKQNLNILILKPNEVSRRESESK